jgi:Pentapeptide repeats (8 copies)
MRCHPPVHVSSSVLRYWEPGLIALASPGAASADLLNPNGNAGIGNTGGVGNVGLFNSGTGNVGVLNSGAFNRGVANGGVANRGILNFGA